MEKNTLKAICLIAGESDEHEFPVLFFVSWFATSIINFLQLKIDFKLCTWFCKRSFETLGIFFLILTKFLRQELQKNVTFYLCLSPVKRVWKLKAKDLKLRKFPFVLFHVDNFSGLISSVPFSSLNFFSCHINSKQFSGMFSSFFVLFLFYT